MQNVKRSLTQNADRPAQQIVILAMNAIVFAIKIVRFANADHRCFWKKLITDTPNIHLIQHKIFARQQSPHT